MNSSWDMRCVPHTDTQVRKVDYYNSIVSFKFIRKFLAWFIFCVILLCVKKTKSSIFRELISKRYLWQLDRIGRLLQSEDCWGRYVLDCVPFQFLLFSSGG